MADKSEVKVALLDLLREKKILFIGLKKYRLPSERTRVSTLGIPLATAAHVPHRLILHNCIQSAGALMKPRGGILELVPVDVEDGVMNDV